MDRRKFIGNTLLGLGGALCGVSAACAGSAKNDHRLKDAFRQPQRAGWTLVHLEGEPSDIGFQHGYLLAPEIDDAIKVVVLEQTHNSKRGWGFFRDAAKNMIWPHTEHEYREEMTGISQGLQAHGLKWDLWDVVALNTTMEWGYYLKQ